MANKRIGKLKYSLALRKSNPSEKNSEKKVYATVQSDETIDLDLLAAHMTEHNTPFTEGTLVGVLKDMMKCVVEQMLAGKRVKLGGLGTFYVSLSSEGVDSADDFNPASHITRVAPHIAFDKATWDDMVSKVDFELTTTREQQAKAKREEKQAINAAAGGEGGSDNGGGDVTGGDDQTE